MIAKHLEQICNLYIEEYDEHIKSGKLDKAKDVLDLINEAIEISSCMIKTETNHRH